LNVDQDYRLKAGPDFLQRVNEPGHFVEPDFPVQRKPIEPFLGATAAIEEPHDHALPEGCMVVLGLCRPRRHARL
jgi:hypothetical protein